MSGRSHFSVLNSKPKFTLPTCQIFYLTKSILKSFKNGDSIALRSLDSPLGSYSLDENYNYDRDGNEKKFVLGFVEDDVYRSTVIGYMGDCGIEKQVKLESLIKDGYSSTISQSFHGVMKKEETDYICISDYSDEEDNGEEAEEEWVGDIYENEDAIVSSSKKCKLSGTQKKEMTHGGINFKEGPNHEDLRFASSSW